jgi:hypothetical protein
VGPTRRPLEGTVEDGLGAGDFFFAPLPSGESHGVGFAGDDGVRKDVASTRFGEFVTTLVPLFKGVAVKVSNADLPLLELGGPRPGSLGDLIQGVVVAGATDEEVGKFSQSLGGLGTLVVVTHAPT